MHGIARLYMSEWRASPNLRRRIHERREPEVFFEEIMH
jgi:hypothetical protein